ncbi:exportin-6-A [Neocloeon triangulifer]|uniref:exportin-6-A n=1 Tax=Neocloeon triangulifer TaxID=2078957 RepID=UPI00286ECBAB|nr:exportin-6-A [Neocloeon triangulifer]
MGDDNGDLKTLEALLDEFFSGAPAQRQREIEQILLGFGSQRGSWGHCLNFLSRTSNQFVSMFCLTTIETVVNRQWQGLPWEERVQLKVALNSYTLQNHKHLPPFLRNKLVKLVVDIARHDWPHFYPEFFDTILQLIHSSDHTVLGLVFALTASEELVSPREDLSSSRKDELRRLLLLQVPSLFRAMTGVLQRQLERQKTRTSTPPPSPTHGQIDSCTAENSSPSDSLLLSGMLAAKLGTPGLTKSNLSDEDDQAVCSLALKALAQYLSWVPLDNYLTPDLIKILFHYAALPEHVQVCGDSPSLGVQAMCAINELLYKQCVPAEWHDLLLEMFGSVFTLLQKLLSDGLESVEEIYLEKFSEFLRVFVTNHLHRFEGNRRFPMSEFLNLLLRFTFQQPTFEGQLVCLELWLQLISYLSSRVQDRTMHKENILEWYKEALLNLLSHVLTSIQFKYNQAKLEELDDENMDSDDQTEWQHYLCQHIETIAKIAELLPVETYSMVLEAWESSSMEYVRLGNTGVNLQEHEASRLHCILHDLSSLSQALGRLCDGLETEQTAALAVAERLANLASFGAQTKMYLPLHCPSPVLQPDLLTVHAQVLAALKAWAPWLGEVPSGHKLALECIRTAISTMSENPPPLVAHAAAHLLVSLTASLRSPEVSSLPEMQALLRQAPSFPSLPHEDKKLVLRSLANTLLLPWAGVIEQQWPERQSVYSSLIGAITADLQGLPNGIVSRDKVTHLVNCLQLLTDQVENLSGEGSNTKRVLSACVAAPVSQCLELFPVYVNVPEACEALLEIFLAVFKALQAQLGAQFAERMAQVFLEVFTGDRLTVAVLQLDSGPCVIDKFLRILQLIIQEPSQAFKRFVPSTMNLCMDHIYPLVCERPCPDVKVALLELLAELVLHNWRLFFKGGMRCALLGKENSDPEGGSVEHKDQLLRILRAFGQCLLQTDPAAFKVSLESLEKLNSKCKLYQKTIFKEELLPHFLTVLLQCLVDRNHGLLQDEVTGALYSMAAVDFEYFYLRFVPSFLAANLSIDNSQKQTLATNLKPESDLPSFSQGILRLVNDLHCYQLCNASLPEGTIRL